MDPIILFTTSVGIKLYIWYDLPISYDTFVLQLTVDWSSGEMSSDMKVRTNQKFSTEHLHIGKNELIGSRRCLLNIYDQLINVSRGSG